MSKILPSLHEAVLLGNLEKVKKAQNSSTLNSKNDLGQTPLHVACAEGFVDIAKYLLKKKANVNDVDSRSWTPLHCAATCRDPTKIIELCKELASISNIDLSISSSDGATAFYYLARYIPKESEVSEYLALLRSLLDKGACIYARNAQGEYPHHQAVMKGNSVALKFLLEIGLHPDLTNAKGETILHYAALSGNKEMVKVLIDLGCNRYIRDSDGKLAVDLAKKLDKRDIVELLTDSKNGLINTVRQNNDRVSIFFKTGQDFNTTDKNGMTALHHAATLPSNKTLHLILTSVKKLDLGKQDLKGNTVLHYLAPSIQLFATSPENSASDSMELVKMLVEKGAPLDKANSLNESPLHLACLHGNLKFVKALLGLNCQLEIENELGETPIFYALKSHQKEISILLKEKGVQHKISKLNETPESLASKVGLKEVALLLEKELNSKQKKEKEKQEKEKKEKLEKEKEKQEKEKEKQEKEKEKLEKEKKREIEKEKRKTSKLEKKVELSEPTAVRQIAHVSTDFTWTGDPEEIFILEKKVGEGAFGTVYRACHKQTGFIVAIKTLPSGDAPEVIEKEIAILRQCRDPNIVSYYGSNIKGNLLWILMEFCGAGSVADLLKELNKEEKKLSEDQISAILIQVVKGIAYLHNRKLVHRDLKPANVLLNASGEAKIADFGVSAQLNQTIAKARTTIGTPIYMSPEVISGADYDFKFDIWSLGISLIEIVQGHLPFGEVNIMRAIGLIVNGAPPKLDTPEKYSPELNAFIAACLTKDPLKRPNATQLLTENFVISRITQDNKAIVKSLLIEIFGEEELSKLDSSYASSYDSTKSPSPKTTVAMSPALTTKTNLANSGETKVFQSSHSSLGQDPEMLRTHIETLTKELKESRETIEKQKEEIERLKKEVEELKRKKT